MNPYFNIGIVEFEDRKPNKSIKAFESALKVYKEIFGERDCRVSHIYSKLVKVYFDIGKFDLAWKTYIKSMEMYFDFTGVHNSPWKLDT